jgi:hypothetical protein
MAIKFFNLRTLKTFEGGNEDHAFRNEKDLGIPLHITAESVARIRSSRRNRMNLTRRTEPAWL